MNPFLHLLVSLCVSVCRSVCPAQPAPSILPHTPGLSLPRAPSVSSWLQDRGEKKEIWSLAPWGPAQKWGGGVVSQTDRPPHPTPPSARSPRPQGSRRAGLRNLRATPGRTHPAGGSLPACCSLLPPGGRVREQHPFLQHPSHREPRDWGAESWGSPSYLAQPRTTKDPPPPSPE